MANLAGVPRTHFVVDALKRITREWDQWLQTLVRGLNNAAQAVGLVELTAQAATVAPTAIPTPVLTAGLYRLTYSQSVTRAATVSSALTPTFAWTSNGASMSQSGAAMTGNMLTTQQNGAITMTVDARTSVTYGLVYASSGATTAQFAFSCVLEELP
jgi:hypothetical protein